MISERAVRPDLLSEASPVQDMLRAMFLYGCDYFVLADKDGDCVFHKDRLVGLLEQGQEGVTLEKLRYLPAGEPPVSRARIEDAPPETQILRFADSALSKSDLAEYRRMKVEASQNLPPVWWQAPMPMFRVCGEVMEYNDAACALIPQNARLAARAEEVLADSMLTCGENGRESTFAVTALDGGVYLLEDISGDFEMAEDLVWWAAVGRALVRRMEKNGLILNRLLPHEEAPADASEVLTCSWEGEEMGKLSISIPAAAASPGRAGETSAPPQKAGRKRRVKEAPEPSDGQG